MFAVTGWNVPTSELKRQKPLTFEEVQLKKKEKKIEARKKKRSSQNANEDDASVDTEGKDEKTLKKGDADDMGDLSDDPLRGKGEEEKPKISPDDLQRMYERSLRLAKLNEKKGNKKGNEQKEKKDDVEAGDASGEEKKRKRGKKDTIEGVDGYETRVETRGPTVKEKGGEKKAAHGDQEPRQKKLKKTLKEKKREKKAIAAAATEETLVSIAAPPQSATKVPTTATTPAPILPSLPDNSKLTPLQRKMREKLTSARFRHINETLYTTPSASSYSLFQSQPEMFTEYHAGFRQQVEVWPENPVDIFIDRIAARAKVRFSKFNKPPVDADSIQHPLPSFFPQGPQGKKAPPITTIADLGCGDAKIARTFQSKSSPLPNAQHRLKILSYDLSDVTHPDVITKADIANLHLEDECVDITIFCLALMGTNYLDFIEEAARILRFGGECWVAEIKSRFSNASGNGATPAHGKNVPDNKGKIGVNKKKGGPGERDHLSIVAEGGKADDHGEGIHQDTEVYKPFIQALSRRGLVLRGEVDASNKMFVRMEFVKTRPKESRAAKDLGEDYDFSQVTRAGRGGGVKLGVGGAIGSTVGQPWKPQKKEYPNKKPKFLEETEEELRRREEKLLKPCVYKLR